jgi:hypothetical protein
VHQGLDLARQQQQQLIDLDVFLKTRPSIAEPGGKSMQQLSISIQFPTIILLL